MPTGLPPPPPSFESGTGQWPLLLNDSPARLASPLVPDIGPSVAHRRQGPHCANAMPGWRERGPPGMSPGSSSCRPAVMMSPRRATAGRSQMSVPAVSTFVRQRTPPMYVEPGSTRLRTIRSLGEGLDARCRGLARFKRAKHHAAPTRRLRATAQRPPRPQSNSVASLSQLLPLCFVSFLGAPASRGVAWLDST